MKLIWATRGRTWGFRLLRTGDLPDPLLALEAALSLLGDEPQAWRRDGPRAVVRFLDPRGRQDLAGRVIPHEAVLLEPEASNVDSFEEARRAVWAEVEEYFDRVWELPEPPAPTP